MNTFKERLVLEHDQLEEKLNKLDDFLKSEKVVSIESVQRTLLHIQATSMNTYLTCLKERLLRL
ncbi:hypothetical protein CLV62_12588 [Dysgonomonas alginatilytica]|uniref:Uncharacterized protein n=1 Tax=Dysgonomonas alginatilytica TaxID=1605892 RepID=A0A2V3PKB3_9BACT|nr:hypothetical protein [Dysgonomonas alginatilytica]PXV61255.1 hypothetical protein CLV62_12588 [Dysgonomonas alginatilytica]